MTKNVGSNREILLLTKNVGLKKERFLLTNVFGLEEIFLEEEKGIGESLCLSLHY